MEWCEPHYLALAVVEYGRNEKLGEGSTKSSAFL
jgi:hypothetical protein